jgi:predicted phage-related endonuclease
MTTDLTWRRDVLGSSDAPAIVGVDPFRTAGDLWAEKTGRLPERESDDVDRLGPRALGHALEPLLLNAAEKRLGVPIARQVWYRHPTAPLGVSVDGLALVPVPTLVEGKTCGILNRPAQLLHAYGDEGTDEIPESVLIQVTHALVVLNAQPDLPPIRQALVVALLGDGRGLRFYPIPFDVELGAELFQTECDFWTRYVEGDQSPPDPPSLETLARVRRRVEFVPTPLDDVLVGEWLHAKQIAAQATKFEEMTRRMVLANLGDGDAGVSTYGTLTYREHDRKGYTVQPGRVRTLRFRPAEESRV